MLKCNSGKFDVSVPAAVLSQILLTLSLWVFIDFPFFVLVFGLSVIYGSKCYTFQKKKKKIIGLSIGGANDSRQKAPVV
jgi:hypothetical protein